MQPEWLGCGREGRFEQTDQAFTFGPGGGRMKQQLAGLTLVIRDQCPAIQPQARQRQTTVIAGALWKPFQPRAEVVIQQADQPARKGQLATVGQRGRPQVAQCLAQTLEKITP